MNNQGYDLATSVFAWVVVILSITCAVLWFINRDLKKRKPKHKHWLDPDRY